MKEQDYILFENYNSGELSKEEIVAFEDRLNSDAEFKSAFTTFKEASSFLEHKFGNEAESTSFKNNLESISNTYFEDKTETKTEKQFNFYKYAIAASVALFLGYFTFNQFSNPTYSDFADYDSISLTVRGNEGELKTKAENAFNTKNYEEAELLFNKILAEDPKNLEVELYKSITLIETGQFSEADEILWGLSETDSAYKNKAKWYWVLSKLKQKDFEECVKILKTIPEDAEDYKQAQKLLKKLD